MILQFKAKNILSIRDEQTLDFTASADNTYEEYAVVKIKNVRISKLGVIYGPNASGKSNILKALFWLFKFMTNEDLRKFGMIPEFIGRLPIVCPLQGLDANMLVKILKEPKNAILKQYQKLLALDEVQLEFEDDALMAIAEKALAKDTGARALRSIIEEFMLDIMYEIPKDENIGKVTITRAYVEGKGGPMIEIRTVQADKNRQPLLEDKKQADGDQ